MELYDLDKLKKDYTLIEEYIPENIKKYLINDEINQYEREELEEQYINVINVFKYILRDLWINY